MDWLGGDVVCRNYPWRWLSLVRQSWQRLLALCVCVCVCVCVIECVYMCVCEWVGA